MKNSLRPLLYLIVTILLTSLCFPGLARSGGQQNITVQLQWKHQFEFAGYYAAIEQGYYADRGLHVALREYENGMNIIDEVLSNRAQYGTINSSIVSARLQGKPVKLLANYFKRMPMVLITSPSIKTMADLRGKILMASKKDLGSPLLKLAFESENLKINRDIKIITHTFNADPFIKGRVDAMTAFITNEPFYLEQQGVDFNIIEVSDYMRSLGDLYLFGADTYVARHQNQTQDFIEATNEGWRYALDHKEEIADLILRKYSQRKSRAALLYEAEKTHDMILPLPLPIGGVYKSLIKEVGALIMKQEQISDTGQLDDFIFDSKNKFADLLTDEERDYLASITFRRAQALGSWMPFRFKSTDTIGINADYWALIVKKLGIQENVTVSLPFHKIMQAIENEEVDLYASTTKTKERQSYAVFSDNFEVYPVAMVAAKKTGFILNGASLENRVVAVGKNYSAYFLLKDRYPSIKFIQVRNTKEALQLVASGKAYAAVDILPSLQYQLNYFSSTDLQLAGVTDVQFPLQVMVAEKHARLIPLLNKAISSITPLERTAIQQKWLTHEVITATDYTLLWQVVAGAGLLIGIFVFWNLRMVREINRRKLVEKQLAKSEELFRKIVENAPVLIAGFKEHGEVLFWNNACEQLFGYSIEELRAADSPLQLFYPDPEVVNEIMQSILKNDGNFTEWHPITKTGEQLDVYWANIAGPDGVIISLGYDFTEHKQILSDLKDSREQAKAANRAKSRFLANMSHEIRTPMNAIIGMTQLVLDTELNEKQRNFLSKVNISATALLDIINDILDFSKIEAEKMDIENIDFSLDTVLNNLRNLISLKAVEKGLQLNINKNPEIPEVLKGDPLRIGQILTNLANNAVKFTERGEVSISVLKEETVEGEPLLHFYVSDTGIGLAPEEINSLFTSFSQADSSVSRKFGGSGLGLAISKGLVEIMGGKIWGESVKGKGSQFHFTLPLEIGDAENINLKTVSLNKIADVSLKGRTVLLVEDNAFNQELACEILQNKGMVVSTAANGQEAVDILADESFDLILMDIQMPVMDGYEATVEIRKNYPFNKLPIIALTANIMDDDRKRALKTGMNDIIGKPLDVPEMLSTMERWL